MATRLEARELEELRHYAREHHVSYAVEEEPPAAAKQVGRTFDVRLFATHGEDRLEAPSCPACVEVTQALHSLAARIVATADASSTAEVLESSPVLFAPTPHGPDEVSVVLRVLEERSDERGASGSSLHRIEDRLRTLGVSRR